MGLETVYKNDKLIWTMSYYGNFKKIPEEEFDRILREALLENWQTIRIWKKVEWKKEDYKYVCQPDFKGSIEEIAGIEKIYKQSKDIYTFVYAGGLIRDF